MRVIAFLALAAMIAMPCTGRDATADATTASASAPRIAAHVPPAPNRCADDAGWDDPAVPRHVYGNTWYVGTCGITALLLVSPQGAVLIDGTTAESAPAVERNIAALGVPLRAVRYILGSHEHSDHAGGIARLQRDTGAAVLARAPAAAVLARGRSDRGDPQSAVLAPMPPVAKVETIEDGHVVRLGDAIALTAISDDAWRFGDDKAHPGYVAAFHDTLATVAALPCDVLLTPHPAASAMWRRLPPDATQPLADAGACKAYAAHGREGLEARLAKERAGLAP